MTSIRTPQSPKPTGQDAPPPSEPVELPGMFDQEPEQPVTIEDLLE